MRLELQSPCNVAFCPRLPGLAVSGVGDDVGCSLPSYRTRQGFLSRTMQPPPTDSPSSSDARAGRHAGTVPACLMRGGRMGELMRSLDWTGTRLGAPETWPQSLRTSISICLDCHFP